MSFPNYERKELVGKWITDPTDKLSVQRFGSVIIEFKDNGEMIYTIESGNKKQIIQMTYEIDGNFLITDQPSAPRKESTEFNIVNGRLNLNIKARSHLISENSAKRRKP